MARSRWLVLVGAVAVVVLAAGCSSGGGGDDGGGDTTYTLSVTLAGVGAGTVTSSPAGISCSSGTCTHDFPVDTSVTLTASPGAASTFAGWDGPGCVGTSGPCTVTVNGPVAVTATFDAVATVLHTLTVSVGGTGFGIVASAPAGIDCGAGGPCSAQFTEGAEVVLSAAPAGDGSTFASWGGDCAGEGTPTCTVTMSTDLAVTATFDPPPVKHRLSVTVTGPGSGSVTSVPTGINCSSGTCSYDFVEGTEVTLTATPAATGGAFFQGWSGACAGTGTCVLTMDGDLAATATFSTRQTVNITVVGDGTGTVTSDPPGISCTTGSTTGCSADFVTGTTVTLTGTPAAGSSFYGWSPTCDASPDPCVFDIQGTASLTATFPGFALSRPFPSGVRTVAKLGTTLIAAGGGGRVVTSTDGLAWTGRQLPTSATLRGSGVDAGGTTVAMVGDGGTLLTSTDATSWSVRNADTSSALNAVVQGGGAWVAVGAAGTITTSTDGVTWSAQAIDPPYDLLSVAWGNGSFVAVGVGGTVLSSSDGQTWSQRAAGVTAQTLPAVAYDAAAGFVAAGTLGVVLTSPNGIDWTKEAATIPAGGGVEVSGVAAHSGTFAALTTSREVYLSADGTAWANSGVTYLDGNALRIAAAGATFFVLGEDGIWTSDAGTSWAFVASLFTQLHGMAYGAGRYVLVGFQAIYSSPDGLVWTSRYAARGAHVQSVVYGNGTFIAVSGSGILKSLDGDTWIKVRDPPTAYGGEVAYGAGKGFVIATADSGASAIWTCPDAATPEGAGLDWTMQVGTLIDQRIYGLVYGASKFVAVGGGPAVGGGTDSSIYTNADPATSPEWVSPASPLDHVLGAVDYGNSAFVASDVQSGVDAIVAGDAAIVWTGPYNAQPFLGQLIAFGGGVFLSQTLLTSANGQTWTPLAYPPRGFAMTYAATHDGPGGWVLATTDSLGLLVAVHP